MMIEEYIKYIRSEERGVGKEGRSMGTEVGEQNDRK